MSDVQYQHVTGEWSYLVDDGVSDADAHPDEVRPSGTCKFVPHIGNNNGLPAGAPSRTFGIADVPGIIINGVLCDTQGRVGVDLVSKVGVWPVWWTVAPRVSWKGRPILAAQPITFAPSASGMIHLNDLVEPSSLPAVLTPDGSVYIRPTSGIPESDLSQALREKLAASGVTPTQLSAAVNQMRSTILGGVRPEFDTLGEVAAKLDADDLLLTAHQTALDNRFTKSQADVRFAPAAHTHPTTAIVDLAEFIQDTVAGLLKGGTNVTTAYDDAANTFTINATASGGGTTDPEIVRDVIGGALVAGSGVTVMVDDAGDTLTIGVANIPQSAVAGLASALTNLQNDLASRFTNTQISNALAEKADTNLFLQLLSNDYSRKDSKGVANGYASLDADGKVPVSQLPASSGGGNDPRTVYVEVTLGDGTTAGPYNFTHNQGTRSIDFFAYRLATPCESLAGIQMERPSKDAVIFKTDTPIPKTRFVLRGVIGTSDVTPPATPAAPTSSAKTTTTIDVSTVAASDPSGIAGYNWWRDGNFVAQTTGLTYQFTGLTAGTQYALTVSVVDGAMNESAKAPALNVTTSAAAPNVARISSARNRTVGSSAGTAAVGITPAAGANKMLLAFVTLSHAAWQSETSLDVKTVSDGVDGQWTKLAVAEYAQEQTGQLWLFAKVPTQLGTARTVTANCGKSGMANAHLIIDVIEFDNVASLGAPVKNAKNNGNLDPVAVTVPTTPGNAVAAELVSSDASNMTPLSGTPAFLQNTTNGDMDGTFDQAALVSSSTATGSTSTTYSSAQTKYATAAIGIDLVRAQ